MTRHPEWEVADPPHDLPVARRLLCARRMSDFSPLERLADGLRPRGVDVGLWREEFLLRRLRRGALLSGDVFLDRHVERLLEAPESLDRFLEDLSIGVSAFFRDPLPFAWLQTQVVPELCRRTRSPRAVSIGCATGQEAWSLAMLLAERTDSFDLLGVDRSLALLTTAREGRYADADVAGVTLQRLDRWFVHRGEHYEVAAPLRPFVRFEHHDAAAGTLPSEVLPGSVDLLLCRNVLIYLSERSRSALLEAMVKALAPGGYLVVGDAEKVPPRADLQPGPEHTCTYRKGS